MPTYLELKAQAEQLRQQAEQARLAELDIVLAEIRARVAEYALTAEQIFGRRRSASATRVGQGRIPARYRDPKQARRGVVAVANPAGSREKRERFLIEQA